MPVFLSERRLAILRERLSRGAEPTASAFGEALAAAGAALDRRPHVPAQWYVPGYYRDAAGHIAAKRGLEEDGIAAYTLALCYQMTGEARYAEAASRLIDGWTALGEMRTEDDSMLSFSYHYPALIFAGDLIRDHAGWDASCRAAFSRFVRERALPMHTMDRRNNWGNWGLVLFMACAAWLHDRVLLGEGVARLKAFVESQIAADGHLPHEVGRNNGVGERGIWYTHFALMPQTLAAEIARLNGHDLYEYVSPSGRTLRSAFERVAPWARDPRSFPYFRGADSSEMAGTNYVSYFEILNARWPHPDATAMVREMRPLSARHCAPHLTFTHGGLPVGA